MPHYDPQTLALLALGESDVTADGGAHLSTCEQCRGELSQLADLVAVARTGPDEQGELETPPDSVWQGILAGIAEAGPGGEGTGRHHQDTLWTAAGGPKNPATQTATRAPDPSLAALVRRPRWSPALVAVAAALVGALVGTGVTLELTRNQPAPPIAAAQIALQPLEARAAHGTAVLDHTSGDQRTLAVHVEGLPSVPGSFYEVWLMNATPQRLLSLGILDSSHAGVFQIPAGLDLSRYPVVDISLQAFNGSPAHSGDSAVRGTLPG